MKPYISFRLNKNKYPEVKALKEEYNILSLFLQSWDSSQDIKEDFLPELNKVLNKKSVYEEIQSGEGFSAVAVIYPEEVHLHTNPEEQPLVMPIELFGKSVSEWLNFLESYEK